MTHQEPYQSNKTEVEQQRHKAIDLYLSGERPSEIARQLGRSRNWFYTTLKRYRSGGRPALSTRSSRPQRVHNRTLPEVEAAIVRIRQTIEQGDDPRLRYAHLGAPFIANELSRLGLSVPHHRTIERVLKRHGLTQARQPKSEEVVLPPSYPWPTVSQPNQLHLFDFVTRVVKGQRFYGCHLLDQARRWPMLQIITHKTATAVAQVFVSAWQSIGLPQALYLDNDVVWRGSSSGRRTFSRIIRLGLWLGIELIFIPPYTPKANPLIENFNHTWDQNFWHRVKFQNLTHVINQLPLFQDYCRYHWPLANFERCTADQLFPTFQPTRLSPHFDTHRSDRLPLTAGTLHFLRFVATDGSVSVLNESWPLDPGLAGTVIRATVDTQTQSLSFFYQPAPDQSVTMIKACPYHLSEEVFPLNPEFQRQKTPLWPSSVLFDW